MQFVIEQPALANDRGDFVNRIGKLYGAIKYQRSTASASSTNSPLT